MTYKGSGFKDVYEDKTKWLDSDRLQEQLCYGSISTVNMHACMRSLNHHERSPPPKTRILSGSLFLELKG